MSVLLSKRHMSSTEHIKNLRELETTLFRRSSKKKDYEHTFLSYVLNLSCKAYSYAIRAETIPIRTIKDAQCQDELLHRSLMCIQDLNAQLGIYYELYRDQPKGLTPKEMETLAALINSAANNLVIAIQKYKNRNKKILKDEK